MSNKTLIDRLTERALYCTAHGWPSTAKTMNEAAEALRRFEWQPIAAAPKNGTAFLAWVGLGDTVGEPIEIRWDTASKPGSRYPWHDLHGDELFSDKEIAGWMPLLKGPPMR